MEDIHREQHKKQMAMHQVGIEAGIRFAVESILGKMPMEITEHIIKQLIKDYGDA